MLGSSIFMFGSYIFRTSEFINWFNVFVLRSEYTKHHMLKAHCQCILFGMTQILQLVEIT